jgi:hypothetical protein
MCEIPQTSVEVLEAAAQYLFANGWHRGSLFDPTSRERQRPACLIGALTAVTRGNRAGPYLAACKILAEHILSARSHDPAKTYERTQEILIVDYNDRRARSVNEVTALLRGAAAVERRRAVDNELAGSLVDLEVAERRKAALGQKHLVVEIPAYAC